MLEVTEERPVRFHRFRSFPCVLEGFREIEVSQFELEEINVVRNETAGTEKALAGAEFRLQHDGAAFPRSPRHGLAVRNGQHSWREMDDLSEDGRRYRR